IPKGEIVLRRGTLRERRQGSRQLVAVFAEWQPETEQILYGLQARRANQPLVVRRVPAREELRMLTDSVDKESAVVVRGRIHRSPQRRQPARAKPLRGHEKKRATNLGVVHGFEKAEEPDAVAVKMVVRAILDCCDATDGFAVSPSD